MDLQQFIDRANRINMSDIINNSIKANEEKILQFNTEDQLFRRGVGGDNQRLKPSYAKLTKKIKKKNGQPTNRVTLRDTGEFHSNFFIEYAPDEITIKASETIREGVDLSKHLAKRYGNDIYGLTGQNIEKLQRNIKPQIIEQLRNGI